MGNWAIVVRGVGCHHNRGLASDANRMAAEFVGRLRRAGHSVTAASITYGAEDDVSQPVNYLDARDELEEDSERMERCGTPVGDELCTGAYGHEGPHRGPLRWRAA